MSHRPSRMVWLCAAVFAAAQPAFASESLPAPASARLLGLAETQGLAEARAPQLAASRARAEAARQMQVAATRLPDPVIKLGVSNVPVSGDTAWSLGREGMTMRSVGVMQTLTARDKLDARAERAEREGDAARAEERLVRATVRRDSALAWLDLAYQMRLRALVAQQIAELELQVRGSEAAFRSGGAGQAELLAAELASGRGHDQLAQIDRELATARARLARWVGAADAARALAPAPAHDTLGWQPQNLTSEQMQAHPLIAGSRSMTAVAQAEARLARANRTPDMALEVMYGMRGAKYADMVSVNLSMPLPWDRGQRQDRELAASLSRVDASAALSEDQRRAYQAEVQGSWAMWQANLGRERHYDERLVPLARSQNDAALAAYRAGSGSLAAALAARRTLLDTRMEAERVALETARNWIELDYLDPQAGQEGDRP